MNWPHLALSQWPVIGQTLRFVSICLLSQQFFEHPPHQWQLHRDLHRSCWRPMVIHTWLTWDPSVSAPRDSDVFWLSHVVPQGTSVDIPRSRSTDVVGQSRHKLDGFLNPIDPFLSTLHPWSLFSPSTLFPVIPLPFTHLRSLLHLRIPCSSPSTTSRCNNPCMLRGWRSSFCSASDSCTSYQACVIGDGHQKLLSSPMSWVVTLS